MQDVISHLVSTNHFWAVSIGAGRGGEPTRYLATFDPVASPAAMVDGVRSLPWATVLEQFVESNEALAESVAGLDADGWETLAEAPPGHVPMRAVALHALWDAWIHERDITLPLGLAPSRRPTRSPAACATPPPSAPPSRSPPARHDVDRSSSR